MSTAETPKKTLYKANKTNLSLSLTMEIQKQIHTFYLPPQPKREKILKEKFVSPLQLHYDVLRGEMLDNTVHNGFDK